MVCGGICEEPKVVTMPFYDSVSMQVVVKLEVEITRVIYIYIYIYICKNMTIIAALISIMHFVELKNRLVHM
jgi:hypothetical protein